MVLDGGLATQLEAGGHDISSAVWSAQVLADDPDAVRAAHRAFFAAGAQVATTASYQVFSGGFAQVGMDSVAISRLLRRSVRLARQVAQEQPGGLGRGERRAVRSGARRRLGVPGGLRAVGHAAAALAQVRHPGPRRRGSRRPRAGDGPCLTEAEALLEEVRGLSRPCWLALTCVGDRTRAGEPVAEAFAMAADVAEVVAVGVNCLDPADTPALVALAHEVSGKPVVVYPNAGERWDAVARRWTGDRAAVAGLVDGWLDAGARLVGGCCRVGPDEISDVARAVTRHASAPTPV